MKLNLMKFSKKANIVILLLLFLLTFAFFSCNKEDLQSTTDANDSTTAPLLNRLDKVDNPKCTAFNYWRKRIEEIAETQQFDCFQVTNEAGITLYEFNAVDLKFDCHSPREVALFSQDQRILIPWENIISISSITNDYHTTYVLSQDGLADRYATDPFITPLQNQQITVYKNKINTWKKQIEWLATTQQFDVFVARNENGETIYKWDAKDLKFDYKSDLNLVLLSGEDSVIIPWEKIISISNITNDYHATYVLDACGLADMDRLNSSQGIEKSVPFNVDNQVTFTKNETRDKWRKIVERLEKTQQFDYFKVNNKEGKTLYLWTAEELKFDYDSPLALTLITPNKQLVIPWSRIMSIANSTTDNHTTYVLAKDGLAD